MATGGDGSGGVGSGAGAASLQDEPGYLLPPFFYHDRNPARRLADSPAPPFPGNLQALRSEWTGWERAQGDQDVPMQDIERTEPCGLGVRIPGCLGPAAVSTGYGSRRAIDAVPHIPRREAVRNQRLQALYRIEKMYRQLFDVENTRWKLYSAPEEEHSRFSEELAHRVEHIYHTLRIEDCRDVGETDNNFLQILLVGKGKKLVAVLPHLSQDQAKQILITITQHLPFLMRMDQPDETLPFLYSPLGDAVEQLTFSETVNILHELSRPMRQSLAAIFENQFGISLFFLLLSHGEKCLPSDMPDGGDSERWVHTIVLAARELTLVPRDLPSNLRSLFSRYVAQRQDVLME